MGIFVRIAAFGLMLSGFTMSANALVTDLSKPRIEIRYSFDGAQLILFGAVGASSIDLVNDFYDIVIVVRGPAAQTVVRRKDKVGGIWVNNDNTVFPTAPGYYAVAASRPLSDIATPTVYASYGIGFGNLPLLTTSERGLVAPEKSFRDALFRIRSAQGLFRQEQDSIVKLSEGLFKTDIHLPATVPDGDFSVETFLFQSGRLKSRDRISLNVSKEGFERAAYEFAHGFPFFYGLTAVIVAIAAGWFAGVVGKK
ncbi:MAG: TIGR02186 family protein [Kordiimonadaceae bacterium]|nr:TIGR02186 family protein [Kordiimonadaceae bacterium]